jgi:hypothetical protein
MKQHFKLYDLKMPEGCKAVRESKYGNFSLLTISGSRGGTAATA